LWLVMTGPDIDAAGVTLLVRTNRHLVCQITALGGENMEHWFDLLPQIHEWAKAEGCDKIRLFGRRGWIRALEKHDYQISNVVLERAL
jgi:hypothetical protein